jgi:hypothetical protein
MGAVRMLEQPSLWLSHPSSVWPPGLQQTGRWLRRVLAAETREPLGHIAISPARRFPWPTGRRIAAYEMPDASLLFTARRAGWVWPFTTVAEADGNIVAIQYGETLASPSRRFLAQRDPASSGRAGRFANRAGTELIRWQPGGGGTLVHFLADVRSEPFMKMGLLAAVLMQADP